MLLVSFFDRHCLLLQSCCFYLLNVYKVLKIKVFKFNECRVTSHNKGHGKFSGILGSIGCVMDDNVSFKIGSGFKLEQRKNPPPIGSVVVFKYKEMTKYGKPRFPVFLRMKEE